MSTKTMRIDGFHSRAFIKNSGIAPSNLYRYIGEAKNRDSFRISAILKSLHLVDVTEDKTRRDIAFKLIMLLYSKLSTRGVKCRELYRSLCQDKYLQNGLARILVLEGLNPVSMEVDILGTIRVVLGYEANKDTDVMPLEAMELVSPRCGWRAFRFEDLNINRSVEIGRITILPECRSEVAKKNNLHFYIMRKLIEGAYSFAVRHYRKSQAWTIMTRYVANLVQTAGIVLKRAPDISLNVQDNRTLFEDYDKYWLKGNPEFYKIIVP